MDYTDNQDVKITRAEFEHVYYNCEEDLQTHELVLPAEVAKEMDIPAVRIDFIFKHFIELKHAFIDGTHCQDCFSELPAAQSEDLGEGHTQLYQKCTHCGRTYNWRY